MKFCKQIILQSISELIEFHREDERSNADHTLLIRTSADAPLEFKSADEYCLLAINMSENVKKNSQSCLRGHIQCSRFRNPCMAKCRQDISIVALLLVHRE